MNDHLYYFTKRKLPLLIDLKAKQRDLTTVVKCAFKGQSDKMNITQFATHMWDFFFPRALTEGLMEVKMLKLARDIALWEKMSCTSENVIKAMYRETSITCLCDNILGKEIPPETPELGEYKDDFWLITCFNVYCQVNMSSWWCLKQTFQFSCFIAILNLFKLGFNQFQSLTLKSSNKQNMRKKSKMASFSYAKYSVPSFWIKLWLD